MKLDLLIKNGVLVEPGYPPVKSDMGVSCGRIVRNTSGAEAATVVEAEGCYVTPGLIDCHVHIFEGCGVSSVNPDMVFLPNGVTTGIDAGTAGVSTYQLFSKTVMKTSVSTVKAYLHPSPTGLAAIKYFPEPVDPKLFDHKAIIDCVKRFRDEIVALKIRISKNVTGQWGLKPLEAAVAIGEEAGLPVAVHTTDPAADVDEVLKVLRKGDIYSHCFNGRGDTIVGGDGRLKPCVYRAREKGIIFDTADGISHFSFKIARQALSESFLPDCISTDLIDRSMYKSPVYAMPYIISKYLALGVSVEEAVMATTLAPAKAFGLKGMGTLQDGSSADIAILQIKEKRVVFSDADGDSFIGNRLAVPQMTIKNGVIVYRQMEFI